MARTAASPAMARSMVRDVSVRIGCGLSTSSDPRVAAIEAGTRARAGLGGAAADVAFLFCTGRHLAAPEATLEGVAEALDPPALVGCGAGGVLGAGREIESGTAVAVWAAARWGRRARGGARARGRRAAGRAPRRGGPRTGGWRGASPARAERARGAGPCGGAGPCPRGRGAGPARPGGAVRGAERARTGA